MKPPSLQFTCRCRAYRFPHRAGAGRCRWVGEAAGQELCSACGQYCQTVSEGHASTYLPSWSSNQTDTWVSSCCSAPTLPSPIYLSPRRQRTPK